MKLIIAGSRHLSVTREELFEAMWPFNIFYSIKMIVSGGASGIDTCGERFAHYYGIPYKMFPADWTAHGKAAGPIRNREMAMYADALLLIWDGKSRGSANMKKEMEKLSKPIYEVILR